MCHKRNNWARQYTHNLGVLATLPCPVHVVGKRIVDRAGHTVFHSPGYRVEAAQVKCSGRTVWVLFHGGAEMSQEAYVGVRSGDGGRTWKLLLSEPYFGVRAPFTIDSYSGPWTIVGQSAAYFVGWCPACGYGTVSLTVTLDGGRHFRRYKIPKLTGYFATGIRVGGDDVTITGKKRSFQTGPPKRKVTIRSIRDASCRLPYGKRHRTVFAFQWEDDRDPARRVVGRSRHNVALAVGVPSRSYGTLVYPAWMVRWAAAVAAGCLVLAGCSDSSRYSAESTWRCLAKKGLFVRLETGPDMSQGVESSVSFQRLARGPRDKVFSGGFSFLRKGADALEVRQSFVDDRKQIRGGPPGVPWIKLGTPTRNVLPWWSAADAKFKANAESCLK